MNRNGITQSTTGDLDEEEEEDDSLVHGRKKRKVAFMPSLGESSACAPTATISMPAPDTCGFDF